MTTAQLVPGDTIHVLRSGLLLQVRDFGDDILAARSMPSIVLERGQQVTLTADLLGANPWIAEIIDDPAAQTNRWGEVAIGRGPFPEDLPRFVPGSVEEDRERERLRQIAYAEPDESKREQALAAIRQQYGTRRGSVVLAAYRGTAGDWPEAVR